MQSQKKGILPRTLDFVFEKLQEMDGWKLQLSFYEIYNEKIYDLLAQEGKKRNHSKPREGLELREEKDGYFNVCDLKRLSV